MSKPQKSNFVVIDGVKYFKKNDKRNDASSPKEQKPQNGKNVPKDKKKPPRVEKKDSEEKKSPRPKQPKWDTTARKIVYAASGTGKSWMAERYPERFVDFDVIFKDWPKVARWWEDAELNSETNAKMKAVGQKWRTAASDGKILLSAPIMNLKPDAFWEINPIIHKANLQKRDDDKGADHPQPHAEDHKMLLDYLAESKQLWPDVPVYASPKLANLGTTICPDCKGRSTMTKYGRAMKKCFQCHEKEVGSKKPERKKSLPGEVGQAGKALLESLDQEESERKMLDGMKQAGL